MAPHHTKDKGDLGVAKAHADLVEKGFTVLFPATEHAAFDLVAYREGCFHRVQVKYRSAAKDGSIKVQLRSVWADGRGTHAKPIDKAEVDTICVDCPETDSCYYLRSGDHDQSVTLRVAPSKNHQSSNVHLADRFRRFPDPTTQLAAPRPSVF